MITSPQQLKAKIRNMTSDLSPKDRSEKAQMLMGNYFMERLLERISVSNYKNNIIIKGGTLVSSYIGIEERATKDIDASIKALTLSQEEMKKVLNEIFSIDLGDDITFSIGKQSVIMEESDYDGVRFMITAYYDTIQHHFQIDMATDDLITPCAIEYNYKTMFENKTIPLMSYNLETLLAEKLQTVVGRGLENTRTKDFYDMYMIFSFKEKSINYHTLTAAFEATSKKRGTYEKINDFSELLDSIVASETMHNLWENYKLENYFVGDLAWEDVVDSVRKLAEKSIPFGRIISKAREEKGLSIPEVAKELNRNILCLEYMEKDIHKPTKESVHMLAEYYGLDEEKLKSSITAKIHYDREGLEELKGLGR